MRVIQDLDQAPQAGRIRRDRSQGDRGRRADRRPFVRQIRLQRRGGLRASFPSRRNPPTLGTRSSPRPAEIPRFLAERSRRGRAPQPCRCSAAAQIDIPGLDEVAPASSLALSAGTAAAAAGPIRPRAFATLASTAGSSRAAIRAGTASPASSRISPRDLDGEAPQVGVLALEGPDQGRYGGSADPAQAWAISESSARSNSSC